MGHIGRIRYWALTGAVLSMTSLVVPARAQDPDDSRRGVARLSLINGDVSVRRGDSGDWVAGVINAPLLTDDHVATGPNTRAEIQFDSSNVVRLGANAELRLAQLEYNRNQMELARGVITFRMLRTTDVNTEIDTPSVSVRPSRQGSYRVSVNDAGETEVTARGGDVEVFTPRGSQWVRSGQTMMARGAASDPEFQIVAAGGMDDWDRWCDSRDRMLLQANSYRYVPSGVYGAEDLDNSGNWVSDPEYGNVWQPTVAADWAPYHNGRWVWEDWYGWTWVSYDPWGWAPYHYGRWFHNPRFGWCWYPGLIGVRHYWSPALVGFFGFGGGGGFGFGFGNVGWVPLAPFEVFHPWWGRGFHGRNFNQTNINITNINVVNTFRNARFNNGVNAVGVHDFQNGRFNSIARVNGSTIREAGAVRGAMPFTPTADHLRFADRQASVVPRGTANTRFFTHQALSPVQRMPIGRAAGMPGGQGSAPAVNSPRGGENTNGFRRFGTPAGQSAPQMNGSPNASPGQAMRNDRPSQVTRPQQQPQVSQPAAPRNENRGGWNRFGSPGNSGNSGNQPAAPRQEFRQNPQPNDRPRNFSPGGGGGSGRSQEPLRIQPPVVRERPSAPRYSAPAPRQSMPSYSAPAPRQSAPSAPRGNSGGGGGGGSRQSGGGGGGHQSGGGGHGGGRR
jgi:uncharacterized protein DUF6600/FecR-like protein